MKKMTTNKTLLYTRIATALEKQILSGDLEVGDKIPSIRNICQEYGVSQSTAMMALYQLERKELIVSRPKSGFYVCRSPKAFLNIPEISSPDTHESEENSEVLVSKVYHNLGNTGKYIPFSLGMPSNDLLPVAKLNKGMIRAMRELDGSGVALDQPMGNKKLRQQIVRWSYAMEADLHYGNVITTAGCLSAISLCLMAIAKSGDRIAMESPVSFGMIQAARSLQLRIVELPTHPVTGIELDALNKALLNQQIDLCLFIPNFSNPLGSCIPDENKKQLVKMLEKYNIPLIENDLFGDIYFGDKRPKSCKTYDESGLVLWCGSVSKSLAPGYRVGWVEAGKFKDKVLKMKMYHTIASASITQEVVADFLETGRYEAHLRKLRTNVYTNYLHFLRTINSCFPEDTMLCQPQGGFVLWAELNPKINAVKLYQDGIQHGLSIAPGKLFTMKDQFNSCIRLNYGLNWNDTIKNGLITMSELIKKQLS